MTWNYRIVKVNTDGNIWYGLFEVYNNKNGLPYTRTLEPISFINDEGYEVIESIGMAFQDALRYEILDDDDIKDENEDGYDEKS